MRIFDKVTNVQSITNIKQKGVLYPDEKIKFKKLGYFFYGHNFNMNKKILQDELQEKYTDKKIRNEKLHGLIKPYVSDKTLERICECGGCIMMIANACLDKQKIDFANFCGNRFCPFCNWRKARKDGLIISILMKYIQIEHKKDFIFLTLTTPNVSAGELEDEIKNYNKSFKKMMERKEVKQVVKGYVRKLEVTYDSNPKITKELYKIKKEYYKKRGLKVGDDNPTYDTYNPHFHVIIAVNKTYFKHKTYIKQNRWLELWQEATGNPAITQVDVRKIANFKEDNSILEIAKYSAKDNDLLHSQDTFDVFYKSLKGKRLLSYNGLFKDAMKKYKAKELEKYKEIDNTEYIYKFMLNWHSDNKLYQALELQLLNEHEYKRVNKQMIDEIEV
jgi:plasmid rolling circle replication initiator protein Rep